MQDMHGGIAFSGGTWIADRKMGGASVLRETLSFKKGGRVKEVSSKKGQGGIILPRLGRREGLLNGEAIEEQRES